MKFNEKLFELRKEKGYSQEELADKLNVARQTVSKWENGTTTPDFDNLIELSKLFEISIDDFVGNDFKKEKLNETQDEQNEENLNIVIDEKEVESKSKKRKHKMIFLILLLICLIIVIITLTIKVIERYKIVDAISERMVLQYVYGVDDKRKQEFYFTKSITKYENLKLVEWKRESCYSKDYNFKKDYYYLKIEPDIVRTEYIDGDDYYDIDTRNKTYKKGEYEYEDYYFMAGNELDIALLDELSLDSIKNRILLALDFSYDIYIATTANEHKDYVISKNGNIEKDINAITVSTSVSEKIPDIMVNVRENKDKSRANFIDYSYIWTVREISDEEIKMPDLTGFTLFE